VNLSIRYPDERRDIASQIDERMQFDCAFALSKPCPRKQGKAQIYCCGIQCIDGLIQVDSEFVVSIERSGRVDQYLCEIGVDAPVPIFVGIGKCASRNRAAYSHVVELALNCAKARFDIPKAFPKSELSKCHAEELVQAGKTLDLVVSVVSQNAFAEIVHGKKVHQLRENSATDIHRPFLFVERNWNGYIAGKIANTSVSNCLQRIEHRAEGKNYPIGISPRKFKSILKNVPFTHI
jgi:hypothetical protein